MADAPSCQGWGEGAWGEHPWGGLCDLLTPDIWPVDLTIRRKSEIQLAIKKIAELEPVITFAEKIDLSTSNYKSSNMVITEDNQVALVIQTVDEAVLKIKFDADKVMSIQAKKDLMVSVGLTTAQVVRFKLTQEERLAVTGTKAFGVEL